MSKVWMGVNGRGCRGGMVLLQRGGCADVGW